MHSITYIVGSPVIYSKKSLVIVNPVLLYIFLNNLSNLIEKDFTILSLFNFKHPFTNKRLIRRFKGDKINKKKFGF